MTSTFEKFRYSEYCLQQADFHEFKLLVVSGTQCTIQYPPFEKTRIPVSKTENILKTRKEDRVNDLTHLIYNLLWDLYVLDACALS